MKGYREVSLTIPATFSGNTNHEMDYDTDRKRKKRNLYTRFCDQCRYVKFCLRSLTHNSFNNRGMGLDTCMEPLFWIVNHVTRYMGPVSTSILMTPWGSLAVRLKPSTFILIWGSYQVYQACTNIMASRTCILVW